MKKQFITLLFGAISLLTQAQTGRVGINQAAPRAGLDVNHLDGLLATGTQGQGLTANLPTGW